MTLKRKKKRKKTGKWMEEKTEYENKVEKYIAVKGEKVNGKIIK